MAVTRQFFGVWPNVNGRGDTHLIVEQVSHHPPIVSRPRHYPARTTRSRRLISDPGDLADAMDDDARPPTTWRTSRPVLRSRDTRDRRPALAADLSSVSPGLVLITQRQTLIALGSGSILRITVKQNGHAVLTVTLPGGKQENYLITLRECRAKRWRN